MKRIRKLSKRVHKTSAVGLCIGAAYEFFPNLQGILPTWWYFGIFSVIIVLHALKGDVNGDQ